jgi:DNA-binding CsgD family transcriptional regulator
LATTTAGDGTSSSDVPPSAEVCLAFLPDQLDEAGRRVDRLGTEWGRAAGTAAAQVLRLGTAVLVHSQVGDGQRACQEAARMMELTRELGASPGPAYYAAATAELAGGTVEQARDYAGSGVVASREEADVVLSAHCLLLSGTTRLLLRDTGGALADLLAARDLARRIELVNPAVFAVEPDLVEALVAAGDLDAATRTLAEGRRRAEGCRVRGVAAALDRAEAVCLAATGAFGLAEETLARALDAFECLGYPLECGRVLLAHAAVEQRRRRPARAGELRAQAEAVFRKAGAPVWEPVGPEHGGPASSWLAGLTSAEQRIAELVAEGHGNREVASTLYVSVKTVEAVLTRVYRKLGVRSRVQLVALARSDAHRHRPVRP